GGSSGRKKRHQAQAVHSLGGTTTSGGSAMTVRLSNGLAFNQDRETKLFQDMARRGKHLDGTALMGHGWSFRDGPAEDWVYQIVYETDPDPEFFDLCRGAGWSHVLSCEAFHIFRAAPGATPLRTEGIDQIA